MREGLALTELQAVPPHAACAVLLRSSITRMFKKFGFALALLSSGALFAQSSSTSKWEEGKPYVRRFSLGATLLVFGPPFIKDVNMNAQSTNPPVTGNYTTSNRTQRIGYGPTMQIVIKGRWAVNAGAYLRRVGYTRDNDFYVGTDITTTAQDERTHFVQHEDTRAKLLDLPVTLRYYAKDRFEGGPRVFFEVGGVLRQAIQVRTSLNQTINQETTTCCEAPAAPHRRSVRGFVGGFGVFAVDPLGIRVIPQVRYVRWLSPTFDFQSTRMAKNEVDAMITLSF